MTWYKCLPLDAPNNQFSYYACPSMSASILFSFLFGLTTIGHIFQAWKYKTWWVWPLVMSGIWQTLAFIVRCLSIASPTNALLNEITYCLVLLAPLWTNAFCYIVLARLVHMFMPNHSLFKIKGSLMASLFVCLDVLAFIVQLYGAIGALSKNTATAKNGLNIYTGGVALQEFFVAGFTVLVFIFVRKLKGGESTKVDIRKALILTKVLFLVLALITARIVYRIIEFSAGAGSPITAAILHNEWYQYVFDTTIMFLAIVILHVYHPGKVFQGPDSRFPTRKEKKAMKLEARRIADGGKPVPNGEYIQLDWQNHA